MKRPRARIHFLPFRDTTERVAASTDGRTLAKGRLHDAVPRTQLGYTLAAWYAAQSCGSVHPPLGSFVTSISASASMLITLRFPTSRPVLRLSPRDVACRTCAKCRRHTESNLLVSPVVLGVGVVATPLTCSLQVGATRGHFVRPKLPASPPVSMYNTNLLGRRAGYKRTTACTARSEQVLRSYARTGCEELNAGTAALNAAQQWHWQSCSLILF